MGVLLAVVASDVLAFLVGKVTILKRFYDVHFVVANAATNEDTVSEFVKGHGLI